MDKFSLKDEELLQRIATEKIQIHPLLWTVIYQHIGDCIIAINLLVRYYLNNNQPIPKDEAKRIMDYAGRIEKTIRKLAHWRPIPEDDPDSLFREIKEKDLKLDPLTYSFIVDHVLNDIMVIGMVASGYLYPPDKMEPISIEDGQKILNYTRSIITPLDRLREVTSKKEAF